MTRKDFILISSAIRATQERINDQLPHQNASFKREEQLRGVRRAAMHICDALAKECGRAFDQDRFLDDCGYGPTTGLIDPVGELRGDGILKPLPGGLAGDRRHVDVLGRPFDDRGRQLDTPGGCE